MKLMAKMLAILFTLSLLLASGVAEESTGAGNRPTESESPTATMSKLPKLNNLIKTCESFPCIPCEKVNPPNTQFKCPKDSILRLQFLSDYWETSVLRGREEYASLSIRPYPDRAQLQRAKSGFTLQKTLDRSWAQEIVVMEEGEDYLTIVSKSTRGPFMYMNDYDKIFSEDQKNYAVSNVESVWNSILHMHNQGVAALNFQINFYINGPNNKKDVIGELQCAVKMGEELGRCQFDPLLTDPLILQSDGSHKADPAIDYYTFGIHIMLMIHQASSNDQNKSIQKMVGRMKEKGEFIFPKRTETGLVLLACYLLQQDREARGKTHIIRQLVKLANDRQTHPQLGLSFVYDIKTNPLSLPEFKGFVERMISEDDSEDDSQGSLSGWTWILLAAGALVLIALVGFFLWRAKDRPNPEATNIEKELGEGTINGPEVVGPLNQ